MSIKVMSAVWELDLVNTDKLILLAFADHADDSGFCYPSYARIAWKCGVSERSVSRAVSDFKDTGIVEILTSPHRGSTQRLHIRPEKGDKLATFSPERSPSTVEKVAKSGEKVATAMATESSLESSEPSIAVGFDAFRNAINNKLGVWPSRGKETVSRYEQGCKALGAVEFHQRLIAWLEATQHRYTRKEDKKYAVSNFWGDVYSFEVPEAAKTGKKVFPKLRR